MVLLMVEDVHLVRILVGFPVVPSEVEGMEGLETATAQEWT